MADDAPKLSRKERLFLSNQMRILEALYPEEAQYISTQRVAVERGYEFLYDFELMSNIYEGDDTLSSDEAKTVWDKLEMFGAIGDADAKADRKSIRMNSSQECASRMPTSACK